MKKNGFLKKIMDINTIVRISCFIIIILVFSFLFMLDNDMVYGKEIVIQNKEIMQLDNGKKIYYLEGEGLFIEVDQKIYNLAKVNSTMKIKNRNILTMVKNKRINMMMI